jgi:hypothetical protein
MANMGRCEITVSVVGDLLPIAEAFALMESRLVALGNHWTPEDQAKIDAANQAIRRRLDPAAPAAVSRN